MGLDALGHELFGHAVLDDPDPAGSAPEDAVRDFKRFLVERHYDEQAICERIGIASLQAMPPHREEIFSRHRLGDGDLDELVRLFLFNRRFEPERLARLLPDPVRLLLSRSGMLAETPDGQFQATVSIFPHDGLHIVTDAWTYSSVWGEAMRHGDRVMYPGHDSTGLAYIASRETVESTLDLCCGSGIQSLLAAAYSETVVGVDINPRAIRMARFNARLNHVTNVSFLTGDLYAPVRGRKFDAVLANPPFVPKPARDAPDLLFRDGGADGEAILARILAGWPDHAADGGRLSIVSDFVNLADLPVRLNQWQGRAIETHLFVEEEVPLLDYAINHSAYIADQDAMQRAAGAMLDSLGEAGVRTVHFGYLVQHGRRPGGCHEHALNAIVRHPVQRAAQRAMRTSVLLAAGIAEDALLTLDDAVEVTMVLIGAQHRIRLDARGSLTGASCDISQDAYTLLERIAASPILYGDLGPEEQALARQFADLGILAIE